jgi:hypothetical protein
MASLTDFDPDNYNSVHGVDETVGVEIVPDSVLPGKDFEEIQSDLEAVETAMEDLDVIVNIRGVMKNSETGLDRAGAKIAQISIENICRRIGYPNNGKNVLVGLEHFEGFTRYGATRAGVEDMGSWFSNVWEAIVRTIKAIGQRILGWLQSLWSESDQRRRTNFYNANKARINAAAAVEAKGTPDPIRITERNLLDAFRIEGKAVNRESVMEVAANMEVFAKSLEELGKDFVPYMGSMEEFMIEYVDVIEAAANGNGGIDTVSEKYESTIKKSALVLEALYKRTFEPAQIAHLPKAMQQRLQGQHDALVSRPLARCQQLYFTKVSNLGNGIERYKTNLFEGDLTPASDYADSDLYTFNTHELEILQDRIRKINESLEHIADLVHKKHTATIKAIMTQLDDVPRLAKSLDGDHDNEEYVINLTRLLGQTLQDMIQDYANLFVRGGSLLSDFERAYEVFFNVSINAIMKSTTK